MADSSSHYVNKTHLQDRNPTPFSSTIHTKPPKRKSLFTHYFFSKSLIIILVLLVFSFFPSQVPEIFKKNTIINKLWELIYLLVIGIAVCYGLFSRKMDSVHTSDESDGAKETYLSGISHISSIFEDGVQNSYGFDEKDSESGNRFRKSDGKKLNQCFLRESMVVINDENYVLEQLGKPKVTKHKSSISKDGAQNSYKFNGEDSEFGNGFRKSDGNKPNQSFLGESMVINDKNYVLEQLGKSKIIKQKSSISEDGVRNSYGFDEKDSEFENGFRKSNGKKLNQCFLEESVAVNENQNYVLEQLGKPKIIKQKSSISQDGVRNSHGFDEKDSEFGNGFQKSDGKKLNQCSLEESMAFIDDQNHVFEQLGKPKTMKQNLGSKSLDSATGKSAFQDSSSVGIGFKKGKFRGLVPINLEEKFKENDSDSDSDSRIPLHWRSKSMRSEKIADEPSHFRKFSAGVLDLKSKSTRVSSQPQMKSSSENKESKELKGETSFIESKPQKFSIDSSSEMNNPSKSKEIPKETIKDSSNPISKPALITSTYKRGKSVRTNRPKEQIIEAKSEISPNQTNDKVDTNLGTNATNVKNLDDYLSDPEQHSGEVDRKADEFIAKFREQIRQQQAASAARRLNLL